MIKMKALRSFKGSSEDQQIKRGREFEAKDERRANELEAHGLAFRLDVKPSPVAGRIETLPANEAANSGPFVLAGGGTGAAPPAPSLHQDRQQRRRR
jgi:hypothetical protein